MLERQNFAGMIYRICQITGKRKRYMLFDRKYGIYFLSSFKENQK